MGGTKDSIITILVANYNNKNGSSSSSSSNNTTTYLATHDFNLLYSRRLRPKPNDNNNDVDDDGEGEEEEEEFITTLISINPISGILEAKIEPFASRRGGGGRKGGQTHEEAFAAFKRYVEGILGEVLKSVPDAVAGTTVSSSPSEITIEQQQPPPAYEVGRNALFVEGGGGVGKF